MMINMRSAMSKMGNTSPSGVPFEHSCKISHPYGWQTHATIRTQQHKANAATGSHCA